MTNNNDFVQVGCTVVQLYKKEINDGIAAHSLHAVKKNSSPITFLRGDTLALSVDYLGHERIGRQATPLAEHGTALYRTRPVDAEALVGVAARLGIFPRVTHRDHAAVDARKVQHDALAIGPTAHVHGHPVGRVVEDVAPKTLPAVGRRPFGNFAQTRPVVSACESECVRARVYVKEKDIQRESESVGE